MIDESLAPDAANADADTPAVTDADSQPGTPAAGEDYEARYKELQATYTRTAQEAAQHRQIIESLSDPERAPEVLSALGFEIQQEDTPDPPQYDNPYDAEIATLKQQLAEQGKTLSEMTQAQQAAAQRAAEQTYFEQEFESLASEAGRDLTQAEANHIVAFAKANPDANGRPDVKAGWASLKSLYDQNFNATVEAKKKAPKAPSGQPGAAVPDLSTREGRLHAAQERLAALNQD